MILLTACTLIDFAVTLRDWMMFAAFDIYIMRISAFFFVAFSFIVVELSSYTDT